MSIVPGSDAGDLARMARDLDGLASLDPAGLSTTGRIKAILETVRISIELLNVTVRDLEARLGAIEGGGLKTGSDTTPP